MLADHFDAKETSGEAQINFSKSLPLFSAQDIAKINADLGVKLSLKIKFELLVKNQIPIFAFAMTPKSFFLQKEILI